MLLAQRRLAARLLPVRYVALCLLGCYRTGEHALVVALGREQSRPCCPHGRCGAGEASSVVERWLHRAHRVRRTRASCRLATARRPRCLQPLCVISAPLLPEASSCDRSEGASATAAPAPIGCQKSCWRGGALLAQQNASPVTRPAVGRLMARWLEMWNGHRAAAAEAVTCRTHAASDDVLTAVARAGRPRAMARRGGGAAWWRRRRGTSW